YWIGRDALHVDANLAWTAGFVAAMAVGYVVHSRWSFKGHGRRDNLARTGGRFVVVSLVSFALNSFWVWLLVQHFGLPTWAPIPPALGLTPLAVFSLNRHWVFK
ncbi:MAG: GtrA family protein, partial [Hyphomicrobiales bacterium]